MIYYGMTPDPSLSAKMVMTELELERLDSEPLRKNCYQSGNGKFNCLYAFKGNKIRIGVFDTKKECNAAWDKADEKYNLIRAKDYKGYQTKKYPSGTIKYSVKLEDGWKQFDTTDEASEARLAMIDRKLEALGYGKGE